MSSKAIFYQKIFNETKSNLQFHFKTLTRQVNRLNMNRESDNNTEYSSTAISCITAAPNVFIHYTTQDLTSLLPVPKHKCW